MHIGSTQMHPVTLAAIVIELLILGTQAALYLQRPHDNTRLWYIGLLVLIILLNLANGLLPDPGYGIPLVAQHNIVNALGFATVSYFPLFFYKGYGLERLRFHAFYSVALCYILPYLVFFGISYSIHGDLEFTHRYGFIVPTFYSIVLLVAIAKAIRSSYREKPDRHLLMEELAIYVALLPWSAITLVVYFGSGQFTETLFVNLGFLVLSGLLLYLSIRQGIEEHRQLENLRLLAMDIELIEKNCKREMLSKR